MGAYVEGEPAGRRPDVESPPGQILKRRPCGITKESTAKDQKKQLFADSFVDGSPRPP